MQSYTLRATSDETIMHFCVIGCLSRQEHSPLSCFSTWQNAGQVSKSSLDISNWGQGCLAIIKRIYKP